MSSSKTGEADVLEFQPEDNETVYLTHLPKQIWLQTGSAVCDGIDGDEIDFRYLDLEALTWCADDIEYGDVKFVRYDIHDALQEQNRKLRSALELIANACHADDCDRTKDCKCFYASIARAALKNGQL